MYSSQTYIENCVAGMPSVESATTKKTVVEKVIETDKLEDQSGEVIQGGDDKGEITRAEPVYHDKTDQRL